MDGLCGEGSAGDDNGSVAERYLDIPTLGDAEQVNRKADKHGTIRNLLRAISAGIANLCSGSTTFTRASGVQIIAEIREGLRFLTTSEEIHGIVKRGLCDPGALMQITHGVKTLREHEEGNRLTGDANLASVVVGVGHGSISKAAGVRLCRRRCPTCDHST